MKVVLVPGDGIGLEVSAGVRTVFERAGVPIEWVEHQAGLCAIDREPGGLPSETLAALRAHPVALKGPTTTPSGSGHRSVNVRIRKELGLFANLRPFQSLAGVQTRFSGVDLVLFRENIEDTYSGIEYLETPNVAHGIKLTTRVGAKRIIEFAFEFAKSQGRKRVTCIHKANIHKLTDGLFRTCFEEVRAKYPDIDSDELLVDNACMQLVTNPERFDVLVSPNLYGDIISDLCAGLIGGLGVAPAGNIGKASAVFEAVHGSAPDIAGKGVANPTALLLSAVLMLRYIGLSEYANWIEAALQKTLEAGDKTADLGGTLGTEEFVDALCSRLERRPSNLESEARSPEGASFTAVENLDQEHIPCGVDFYVRSLDFPSRAPQSLGSLSLEQVMNRGRRVEPGDQAVDLSDLFTLRYRSEGDLAQSEIHQLSIELEKLGLEWVSAQKLFA